MKLLTPEETKQEHDKKESERIARINKLNTEETEIIKRINKSHVNEKIEIANSEKRVSDARTKSDLEIIEISSKVESLKKEVTKLESARIEAMKPIEQVRAEANTLLEIANLKQNDLNSREKDLNALKDNLLDKREDLDIRESEIVSKENDLDKREKRVVESEEKTKESANALTKKWSEFHKEVSTANTDLDRKKKEIDDGQKANESFHKSLLETEKKNEQDRIAIKQGYLNLRRATNEISKKNNG